MRRRLGVGFACLAAGHADAHGFGARYDLPLPLSLYLCGAALTVVVSCVLLVLLVRARAKDGAYPRVDLLRFAPLRWLASPPSVAAIRLLALAIYAFLLAAGFFGNRNAFRNIVPIAVWALWWVGLAYFSALAGDLWRIVNPMETIFAAGERAYARMRGGKALSLALQVPAWLQAWPALVLYLGFLWMELVWDGSDVPVHIAEMMVAYSVLTWIGMWIFGREAWLANGEALTKVFGVLARFSPTGVRLENRRIVAWELRPYAVGLLGREPVRASEIMLVIAILAAVSFDGFLETPAWAAIADALSNGGESTAALRTAGLVVAPLVFLAVYLVFCRLIAWSGNTIGARAGGGPSARRIAGLFVLTLVPIAIAYQFAHYLSFLVTAGQYTISLVSDPFGFGWDLFGTVNHLVRPNIVDARMVWIVSMGAIVAGHVAALYLGHLLSMREFGDRRAAARSQWPMLVLRVSYTMLSLWIIAQPIVNSR
jgi:hypothetical protein